MVYSALAVNRVITGTAGDVVPGLTAEDGIVTAAAVNGNGLRCQAPIDDIIAWVREFTPVAGDRSRGRVVKQAVLAGIAEYDKG